MVASSGKSYSVAGDIDNAAEATLMVAPAGSGILAGTWAGALTAGAGSHVTGSLHSGSGYSVYVDLTHS